MIITQQDRFLQYVAKGDGCWLWTAAVQRNGYGKARLHKRTMTAHGVAYRLFVGPVPEGREIDHLCRNKLCVNPAHLEAVTHAVNTHRSGNAAGINHRKTHCIRAHPLSGVNLYVTPDGRRQCKICRNHHSALRSQRRKVA